MDVHDPAGHLHGTRERDRDVADANRHGVAIDNHEPALGIHDQARAVIVALSDPGNRIRHVESNHRERGCQGFQARILVLRILRGATP